MIIITRSGERRAGRRTIKSEDDVHFFWLRGGLVIMTGRDGFPSMKANFNILVATDFQLRNSTLEKKKVFFF